MVLHRGIAPKAVAKAPKAVAKAPNAVAKKQGVLVPRSLPENNPKAPKPINAINTFPFERAEIRR